MRNARPATLQLSTGLVIPTISVPFDPRRIGDILEKMARGTYYVGLKIKLPRDVRIRTYYGIPDELESFYKECPEHDLGSGIVRVRRGYDVNEPSFMFCWFRFYDDKSSPYWRSEKPPVPSSSCTPQILQCPTSNPQHPLNGYAVLSARSGVSERVDTNPGTLATDQIAAAVDTKT